MKWPRVSNRLPSRGIGTPKKFFSCLLAMRIAAPVVKPTTTECEMKLTTAPMRASPSPSSMSPTMKVRVSARLTYSGVIGSAYTLREESSTMEAAVVGPDIRCQDEPKKAATIGGIMPA